MVLPSARISSCSCFLSNLASFDDFNDRNATSELYAQSVYIVQVFLLKNNFPMREWHVEHMEKVAVKYVKGLSENATSFEKRNHKKYGRLSNVCKQIEYDTKHGVTKDQVILMLHRVRNDSSYSELRKEEGALIRLAEVEDHFTKPKQQATWYWERAIIPRQTSTIYSAALNTMD